MFDGNPYKILGVSSRASKERINRVFRQRSLRFRSNPDGAGNDRMFQRLEAAYELLSDPERRREFDLSRDDEKQPSELIKVLLEVEAEPAPQLQWLWGLVAGILGLGVVIGSVCAYIASQPPDAAQSNVRSPPVAYQNNNGIADDTSQSYPKFDPWQPAKRSETFGGNNTAIATDPAQPPIIPQQQLTATGQIAVNTGTQQNQTVSPPSASPPRSADTATSSESVTPPPQQPVKPVADDETDKVVKNYKDFVPKFVATFKKKSHAVSMLDNNEVVEVQYDIKKTDSAISPLVGILSFISCGSEDEIPHGDYSQSSISFSFSDGKWAVLEANLTIYQKGIVLLNAQQAHRTSAGLGERIVYSMLMREMMPIELRTNDSDGTDTFDGTKGAITESRGWLAAE